MNWWSGDWRMFERAHRPGTAVPHEYGNFSHVSTNRGRERGAPGTSKTASSDFYPAPLLGERRLVDLLAAGFGHANQIGVVVTEAAVRIVETGLVGKGHVLFQNGLVT